MRKLTNLAVVAAIAASSGIAAPKSAKAAAPNYKIVKSAQFPGTGGIDYVFADSENRRLYVPRGEAVLVFDLDSLNAVGTIPDTRARGVAVDPKSHHGFSSSSPVAMWDTRTLAVLKRIDVQG